MHTAPKPPYNGISIIIDKPSRFDLQTNTLLSSQPAQWLDDEVLGPDYKTINCDVRTLDEPLRFLPGTKLLLLLGKKTAEQYQFDINQHGYPAKVFNVPTVVAFYPQDCCDHRNIEYAVDSDDDDTISDRDIKDSAPTRRSNYRFWTKWHIRKALYNNSQQSFPRLDIRPYPNLDNTYKLFESIQNENLYLDIETSRIHRCITCVGLSSDSLWPTVYVLPAYLYNGSFAYSNKMPWYKLLAVAIKQNRPVIHNAGFDLLVLRAFYKLPLPESVYCTLRANHRCFPEIEKSLAHLIAQWTNLPYHKNVATEVYNREMQSKMWEYNARDVYALKPILDAQTTYAASRKGLTESIAEANSEIVPYLENSLLGLRVNLYQLAQTHKELTACKNIFAKICQLLINKPTFNPGSSKQCIDYFHKHLNYPVINRSDKPPFNPKLGKKELYQLLIKTNNPAIKAILKYRATAKDASLLESELWTPDTNVL